MKDSIVTKSLRTYMYVLAIFCGTVKQLNSCCYCIHVALFAVAIQTVHA